MSRSKAFTRSDIKEREQNAALDPAVVGKIEALLKAAGISVSVASVIKQAIKTYKLRAVADRQERPAAVVAALRPGLKHTKQARGWLHTLPHGVRLSLKVPKIEGELDELYARTKVQLDYWQNKVCAQRPAGGARAGIELRQSLDETLAKHLSEERKRRQIIADVLAGARIKFPNEKKNRGRFVGTKQKDNGTS